MKLGEHLKTKCTHRPNAHGCDASVSKEGSSAAAGVTRGRAHQNRKKVDGVPAFRNRLKRKNEFYGGAERESGRAQCVSPPEVTALEMVGLEVHVSLTTMDTRVGFTPTVVEDLLCQSVLPTSIALYASSTAAAAPLTDKGVNVSSASVRELKELESTSGGLFRLHWTQNTGPHKKLLPSLEAHWGKNNTLLVTIDDDTEYHREFLRELLQGYLKSDRESVVARRVRKIPLACSVYSDGVCKPTEIKPYDYNVWGLLPSGTHAMLALPTGVGGVLYRPHFFHPIVFDEQFRAVAATSDDISFRVAALLKKVPVFVSEGAICNGGCGMPIGQISGRKLAGHRRPSLADLNVGGHGNDRTIKATLGFLHKAGLIASPTADGLLGNETKCPVCPH